jgi:hypothetical protein
MNAQSKQVKKPNAIKALFSVDARIERMSLQVEEIMHTKPADTVRKADRLHAIAQKAFSQGRYKRALEAATGAENAYKAEGKFEHSVESLRMVELANWHLAQEQIFHGRPDVATLYLELAIRTCTKRQTMLDYLFRSAEHHLKFKKSKKLGEQVTLCSKSLACYTGALNAIKGTSNETHARLSSRPWGYTGSSNSPTPFG